MYLHYVAPHVGAWIETVAYSQNMICLMSLPMWERGLKLDVENIYDTGGKSLPMWERGLKLAGVILKTIIIRRSPCGSVD